MHDVAWGPLLVSILAFVLTYVGIFLERVHRTIVAISGAVLMISFGSWLSFYGAHEAVHAVDFDTIMLLLGMMIVVGLFKETGFFQYLAIRAAKLARGRPWLLLVYLGLVTSLVSTMLDNVTTIILIVPVTVSIADILGISPFPFLITEVLLSNIGGVATLIGDPPNILIGSAAGFGFLDFITHLTPIVLLAWLLAQGLLLLIFRSELSRAPSNVERLMSMDERRAIVDPITTRRMLIALGATVILFMLHEVMGLQPGLVALIGACVGLLWVRPDFETILRDIHWDVLLFFIALFVIVGGLEASGVIEVLGHSITALSRHGMMLAAVVVLWVGALASGIISNVPFTIAMLPILRSIEAQGAEIAPLWWALAIGVGFGANLTPLGSAANVVVASLSESIGEKLTFRRWGATGTWVALATCTLGTGAILIGIWTGILR
jgi:Na+/H+ antiporter NhaD/arsenite permease-like protein